MKTTISPSAAEALRSVALPDILTAEAYAAHTGQHPATVRSHLRAGLLPGRRVGRRWFIARLALIAHMSRTAGTPSSLRILGEGGGN